MGRSLLVCPKTFSNRSPTEPGAEATRLKYQKVDNYEFSRVASAPGSVGGRLLMRLPHIQTSAPPQLN